MEKEEKKKIEEWKIDEAVHTLVEYKKIMKDKELKEKAIKKLKERAKEFEEASKGVTEE